MAPSAVDTSFSSHVANQFTSYEKDRQMSSKDVTYATRFVQSPLSSFDVRMIANTT